MNSDSRYLSNLILIEVQNQYYVQDRQVRKWMMDEVKEFLDKSKIFYEYVSSLEKNPSELKEICDEFRSNKLSVLQDMENKYINELSFLRDIGGDVSNYPKYLTKSKK